MAGERMVVRVRGIAEEGPDGGVPMWIRPRDDGGRVVFYAHEVDGPAAVRGRVTRVELTRTELASLFGAIPAAEIGTDKGLWAAFKRVEEFLREGAK